MDNKEEDVLSCGCGHCHSHEERSKTTENTSFVKTNWLVFCRIIISVILLVVGQIFLSVKALSFILHLLSLVVITSSIIKNLILGIKEKDFVNENLLMLIASVVSFILSDYLEGILIPLLFTLGELLENYATSRARIKIASLAGLKTTFVRVINKNGVELVKPEDVKIGSLIEVRRGDRIPIDGILLDSYGELDMKALTGESRVSYFVTGQEVLSGAINVGNSIVVRTSKIYAESTVSQIIDLVEGATSKKAKSQRFITSFARIYTPLVVLIALIIGIIPPLFDGHDFIKWVYKSLSFLVISCPCALVISVPLAFFVGIGALAKKGILIKGSNYVDMLAKTSVGVFDKTGTITKGEIAVVRVVCEDEYNNLMNIAFNLENVSSHPIAKAIVNFCKDVSFKIEISDVQEIPGKGLKGLFNGEVVLVGNDRLFKENGIKINEVDEKSCVYVGRNGKLLGRFILGDTIKENAKGTVSILKSIGIKECLMLSGDNKQVAQSVGNLVGFDRVLSELLPNEKSKVVEDIVKNGKKKLFFTGDGINDAPSLAIADVGISMGKLGSDEALQASDVSIMDDDLSKIPLSIIHSRKIRKIVYENIVFSLGLKLAIMILSVFINLPVWFAMLSDVGVMLLAVLNSFRCSKLKKIK